MAGLGDATRLTEIRQRLLFLLGGLIVYRIGTFVPTPGIDPAALAQFFEQQEGTILGLFNMFSGGALSRLSIFALGVMPYISASIIIQMVAVIYGPWAQLRKEGESGRRKITHYTRIATLFLAIFQGLGAAYAFHNQGVVQAGMPMWYFLLVATVTLTTGTMFLMWLGEQITERGIGNGISMIILAGIIAGLPAALGSTFEQVRTGEMNPAFAILLLLLIGAVTLFVVFVESGQRRIAVNYAKRMVGRRMLAGQASHLPFKLNMSGVIPPIFASSLLLFPATLASFAGTGAGEDGTAGAFKTFMQNLSAALGYGQPLHMALYAALIIFFCFFYTGLVFNSRETADNLKKAGAFIPGIRPGQQTGEYIDKVLSRLTLWGAIYVTAVCLLPEILISWGNVPFYFGGTSLLIIVVVVMDFIAQLRAHMMSHQYEGLIKKANLRGAGRPGQLR
ncbi:MAG: preprotein translocase subunit SecY [Steroidobacteraceae bacterium]|jgi:preprotein translocase subunit SecY|nr:preprotein translocase subunit SecY [Steroidobacteraceae bacterium]